MTRAPRILTVIFPSNYPNFGADSIYQFNRGLFRALLDRHHVDVFSAGPSDMPPLDERIPCFALPHGINKFEVRFHFPWGEMRSILETVRPDVCFVNMPEQATAISILAKDELRLSCRIVTYVHYIPAMIDTDQADEPVQYEPSLNDHGHGPLLVLRLLEGVAASDVALVCSNFGVRLLRRLAAAHFQAAIRLPTILRMPPPVDFTEVDEGMQAMVSREPRFVYNHRLYDEYGTGKIFRLIQRIAEQETRGFKILVTNPTAGRPRERSRLNPRVDENLAQVRALSFVEQEHFWDRSSYIGALSSVWGGIAPFKPHALWSMSVMDVLACGRAVLSFDIAAFREMGLPDELLVRNEDDFERAVQRAHYAEALLAEACVR